MKFRARHWLIALLLAALLQLTLIAIFNSPQAPPGSDAGSGVEIEIGTTLTALPGSGAGESGPSETVLESLPGSTAQTTPKVSEILAHITEKQQEKAAITATPAAALATATVRPLLQSKAKPASNNAKVNKRLASERVRSATQEAQPAPAKAPGSTMGKGRGEAVDAAPGQSTNGKSETGMADVGSKSGIGSAGQSTADAVSPEYYHKITAWLEKHKYYPRQAIQRRQQGVVKVYFRIDREGNLLSREIIASSGYPLLDEAADALLLRASPMPGIPHQSTAQVLEFTVPIMYALR